MTISYNNYYPFGMQMPERSFNQNLARYSFNGKEKDNDMGNAAGAIYDYGFRIYDARVARFLSLDPHAAKYVAWSAYNYVLGNPVLFIDPDGRSPDMIQDDGNKKEEKKSGWTQNHLDLLETFGDNEGFSEVIGDRTGSIANDNRSGGDGDEGDGDKEEKKKQNNGGKDNPSNSNLNTKKEEKPLISGPFESGGDISNNWNNFWYRAGVKANNIDRSWKQGGKKFFGKVFTVDGAIGIVGGIIEFTIGTFTGLTMPMTPPYDPNEPYTPPIQ